MNRALIGFVASVFLLAGCANSLIPPSALHHPSARTNPQTAPTAGGPHKRPVLGADLYSANNYSASVVRRDGARNVAYMRHVLGAQSAGIVWNFYDASVHANTVSREKFSLSPDNVAELTRQVKRAHMSVEYRPLIRVGPHWLWEGVIYPADPKAWFASLYKTELPYLRVAQKLHVQEFVVCTELRDLNSSPLWKPFVARVAKVYHGTVSYAAADIDYFKANKPLLPTKLLGMDAYPHVELPASASIHQLVRAWSKAFSQVSPAVLRRTSIDELGIQAAQHAFHKPEDWFDNQGKLNESVQAHWFTTACKFVQKVHMRGIYFWNVNLATNPDYPPYPSPPTFEGKTGAKAIHGCLKIFK